MCRRRYFGAPTIRGWTEATPLGATPRPEGTSTWRSGKPLCASWDVALLTAVAAAIAVAAAVLPNLDDDKPEVLPPAGEVVEIHADELDPAPAERDPGFGVVLNTG
jgi:hypothetical protein